MTPSRAWEDAALLELWQYPLDEVIYVPLIPHSFSQWCVGRCACPVRYALAQASVEVACSLDVNADGIGEQSE